jgi:hypothetical protein
LPRLASSIKQLDFQIQCDTGPFALRSHGKSVFGGTCSPGNTYGGVIPIKLLNISDILWSTGSSTSWKIQVWAPTA